MIITAAPAYTDSITTVYAGVFYEKYQILAHCRFHFYSSIRNALTFFLRLVKRESSDRADKSCQRIHMGTYETSIFSCSFLVSPAVATSLRCISFPAPRAPVRQSSWHAHSSGPFLYLLRYPGTNRHMDRYPDIFYQCVSHLFLRMEISKLLENI